ncbi:DUF423 domain-containing protein [Brevundimonas sp. 2R-24]|uniref:DUF423 domain-containing protein n=1 Tax=Peiella sedimenti TaxID=3061083 RepID=A0ABT8SKR7_9CAUL|nr:DUF423 domain-containing protein [Caulobacteraceae bacterium XZ-24]
MTPLSARALFACAALGGAVAVMLGAFAAHGAGPQVKPLLTTGAHYLGLHALLALACAHWGRRAAGWLALSGGGVFALSLALVAWGLRGFGAVAPLGGLLMIGAWLLLTWQALRSQSVKD